MNQDVVKVLKNEKLKRMEHPYWIHESIQSIPKMLEACDMDQVQQAAYSLASQTMDSIHLLGRGSSYFLCLAGKPLLEELTRIPTHCSVTNVFDAYAKAPINNSLVILHSHSGKTQEDVDIIRTVQKNGASTMAVTDYPDSPLAVSVDHTLIGPGGAKVELPAVRSYATTLYLLYKFSIALANEFGAPDKIRDYDFALSSLPAVLAEKMEAAEMTCVRAADELLNSSSFIVLGAGPNYATADEAALSISQSTAVPAFAFELENFIHGPIQALLPSQTVILIAPRGALQQRMLNTLQAVRTIGARSVLLAPDGQPDLPDSDILINLPANIPELISPLPAMLPLWQLAYQFALRGEGSHPDRLAMDKPEFKEAFSYLL